MGVPEDRHYSEDHLWVKLEKDSAVIGITHYAAALLGPVNYVELPPMDSGVSKDTAFAAVETNKAVTELLSPISGRVVSVNKLLTENPDALTDDPYANGWIMMMRPSDLGEWNELMKPSRYDQMVSSELLE